MSNKITENTIEEFAIKQLERLGYQYIYAPKFPSPGGMPEGWGGSDRHTSYEDVLLTENLQNAIRRINPNPRKPTRHPTAQINEWRNKSLELKLWQKTN